MLRLLAACFCAVICAASLSAQGVTVESRILDIDISRFPTIELQVSVTKTASSEKITINNVQLDENGVPQRIEYFDCPEDSVRLSVAVLLDRSASMARLNDRYDRDSTKLREAKKAISIFLDLLGPRDESALFSFTTQNFTLRNLFTVEHGFTFDADAVKGALSPITASGGTRLWEAIIEAVKLLGPRKGRRVLIVLTDGRNQFGEAYHTPAIQAAVSAKIPVYTIGLGTDADIGALSGLAAATGGRFYFAPEASDLSEVFNGIAGSLITDACVLRYTSGNPCLDGSRRNIDLTLSGSGFATATDTFYTVPLQLNPVTVEVQPGLTAAARDTLVMPIIVAEQFSMARPLTYYMTVLYERKLMRYIKAVTDGTMSEGSPVVVIESSPGVLEISNVDLTPFLPTGTLFELAFLCEARESDTATTIEIRDAEVRSICPTELTARDGSVMVTACEDSFIYGDSLYFVLAGDGSVAHVPLRMRMSSPTGTPFSITLGIDYSALPYEIVGTETAGTLSAGGGVIMQETAPGRAEFSVQAVNDGQDSVLFYLRIRVREPQRSSMRSHLPVTALRINSGCRVSMTDAGGGRWTRFLVDGVCEPLVRLRSTPAVSNHPNPFSPSTDIAFTTHTDGPVLVQVMDGAGRIVATLLDAWLKAGEYHHRFAGGNLPAGEYYTVCSTSGGRTVRRMLLLK